MSKIALWASLDGGRTRGRRREDASRAHVATTHALDCSRSVGRSPAVSAARSDQGDTLTRGHALSLREYPLGRMAAGYEVVAAGPEHLEAVTSLYAETAEWHVSLDPGYYVPFDNTTAAAVGELYDKVLRDTTGEAGVHIARPLGSNAHSEAAVGFVLWSIERGGYHDTHFQDVGVIEEVYVQPSSRRGAASAVGADPCRRGAAGVGTALMEAAMEAMRTRGVEDFKLQASTGNTGAIGFYKRLGWRPRQLLMYHSDSKQPPAAPAVPESSHEQISLQVTLSVRCGQVEAFRDLTKEMVQLSASEPGTLVYERFMSKDEETVHAFERFVHPSRLSALLAYTFRWIGCVGRYTLDFARHTTRSTR